MIGMTQSKFLNHYVAVSKPSFLLIEIRYVSLKASFELGSYSLIILIVVGSCWQLKHNFHVFFGNLIIFKKFKTLEMHIIIHSHVDIQRIFPMI